MAESTEKLVALKIKANGVVAKIELPPAEYKYQRMQKGVGELCGFIDIKDIYEELGLDDYCLVFDDEFLLNGRPVLNPIASYLFGYQEYGQPLCGNVLVMKNYTNEDEELDTVGLDDEDINRIMNFINSNKEKIFATANEFMEQIIKHMIRK